MRDNKESKQTSKKTLFPIYNTQHNILPCILSYLFLLAQTPNYSLNHKTITSNILIVLQA